MEMDRQYNNELTPELLAKMDQGPFTAEELAEMDDEVRALVAKQEASRRQHPIIAIYRPAVAGCLTRNGGTGDEFSPDSAEGRKIRLKNGIWASVLTEGGTVSYLTLAAPVLSAAREAVTDFMGEMWLWLAAYLIMVVKLSTPHREAV